MDNDIKNNGLSGREKAIAFMLRKNKPGIAKRKPAPEPELTIGEQTKEGIFLGTWEPKDRDGNSLSKIFNVFAAPQDLSHIMTYKDAVKHIAGLEDWNGFDGANYANDKEIYAALKDGSYNGGWIIPPRELLVGTEPYGGSGIRKGKAIQPDNLFDHKNKGAFKGTFNTVVSGGYYHPVYYWSSTEFRSSQYDGWNVCFSDGEENWRYKDDFRSSCRPVRLVPA